MIAVWHIKSYHDRLIGSNHAKLTQTPYTPRQLGSNDKQIQGDARVCAGCLLLGERNSVPTSVCAEWRRAVNSNLPHVT